jgi:hypothetical protein
MAGFTSPAADALEGGSTKTNQALADMCVNQGVVVFSFPAAYWKDSYRDEGFKLRGKRGCENMQVRCRVTHRV